MSNPYIEKAEEVILHTYNRYPVVFDRGEGVHLYDVDGREYLDFAAGIAVQSLGYNNQEYTQALKDQIDKLTHISNLYYTAPMMEAAEKVVKASGMSRVFFTNSGTEAIEGALKAARKYAYEKYGEERYEIIAMNHSFHGRSIGALSVTGNEKYQIPFRPLVPGIRFAEYNDLESVKAQIEGRKKEEAKRSKEDEAVQKAVEGAQMEIPDAMVDTQVGSMLEEFAGRINQQGLSLEQYMQFTGATIDKLREQMRPDALKRIQSSLVLEAIAKAEGIEVPEEEVQAEIARMAGLYGMEVEKLEEMIDESERKSIQTDLSIQKAVDLITEHAVEV